MPNPEVIRLELHVDPVNETEEMLLKIWSEILNIEESKISTNTSFFDIGGNSLSAITLSNTILKTFSIDLVLTDIFAKRTISKMSDYILTVKQIKDSEGVNEDNIALLI